jgi:selenide,water dikinase
MEVLGQIMRGGLDKMTEAGCTVVGGHTVRDSEIKFGYAVTGLIDPKRVFTNADARAGDVLILTKAIGTGVITTALKQGKALQSWVDGAVRSMTTLNRTAAAILGEHKGVHSVTDVTGFGLMGHGREMAMGAGVTLEIDAERVPRLDGALDAIALGAIPAGLLANRDYAECVVSEAPSSKISDGVRTLMYDPQTSGGLLISVDAEFADELLAALRGAGLPAAAIGHVRSGKPGIILQ